MTLDSQILKHVRLADFAVTFCSKRSGSGARASTASIMPATKTMRSVDIFAQPVIRSAE